MRQDFFFSFNKNQHTRCYNGGKKFSPKVRNLNDGLYCCIKVCILIGQEGKCKRGYSLGGKCNFLKKK